MRSRLAIAPDSGSPPVAVAVAYLDCLLLDISHELQSELFRTRFSTIYTEPILFAL